MNTVPPRTPSAPPVLTWKERARVIRVLLRRELHVRFGRFSLGYAWALLEPFAVIGILLVVRSAFGAKPVGGIPYPLFFASGVLPFLFFQQSINSALGAVESNLALFNYRCVRPSDAVIARIILEALLSLGTTLTLFVGMWACGLSAGWPSPSLLLATLAGLFAFTTGIGLLVGLVAPLWQDAKKIIPIAIRPLFFVSGVFFTMEKMPEHVRPWLLLNPLMHVSELIRESLFGAHVASAGRLFPVIGCAVAAGLLAWLLLPTTEKALRTSGRIR